MRLAWATDLHLNFLTAEGRQFIYEQFAATGVEAFAVSGDLAEAPMLTAFLDEMAAALAKPIYFVLGNHDFYHSGIAETRTRCRELCEDSPRLHYLTGLTRPIPLSSETALVGHDGWADAREGNFVESPVRLNDYALISDLSVHGMAPGYPREARELLQHSLQALGDEAAEQLRTPLLAATESHPRVVIVTHVPPLRAACTYQGEPSDDAWAPHFTCQAVGNLLLEVAHAHPEREFLVLCGHTHDAANVIAGGGNLQVLVGGAEYRRPQIQQIFDF